MAVQIALCVVAVIFFLALFVGAMIGAEKAADHDWEHHYSSGPERTSPSGRKY